jgi:AcrR family transcriptional regulator
MKLGRAYRMGARAEAAAETGRSILAAMQALFVEHPYDRITLEMVAAHAGVTLQTVLRRFGSKDGLFTAAAEDARGRILAQRGEAPAGDVPGAVRNLFDHYEEWGRVALRLLDQEERLADIAALTREGRRTHAEWVERVFAKALAARRGRAREVRLAQLIALTDVYVWKILRSDRGLDRRSAEKAVIELIEGLLASGEEAE